MIIFRKSPGLSPDFRSAEAGIITLTLLILFAAGCRIQGRLVPDPALTPLISNTTAPSVVSPSEIPSPAALPRPSASPDLSPTPESVFTFIVNGDTANHAGAGQMDTAQYFRGMAESIAALPDVRFMITAGDITPPQDTRWTIDRYLGKDFLWFPAAGNHDLSDADLKWFHEYSYDPNGSAEPNIVRRGPAGCEQTTYSFDHLNAHFAVLNVYCDTDNEKRTDGAIVDHLYNWLKDDLTASQKEHVFVIVHEPAFPQPDASAGIVRHLGDSLDKYPVTRDRFWALLKEYHVLACFTGHTHSYSIVDIDGVWQIDAAHSMGARTQSTRSTYIAIHVQGSQVGYDTYRVNNTTGLYELFESGTLLK